MRNILVALVSAAILALAAPTIADAHHGHSRTALIIAKHKTRKMCGGLPWFCHGIDAVSVGPEGLHSWSVYSIYQEISPLARVHTCVLTFTMYHFRIHHVAEDCNA